MCCGLMTGIEIATKLDGPEVQSPLYTQSPARTKSRTSPASRQWSSALEMEQQLDQTSTTTEAHSKEEINFILHTWVPSQSMGEGTEGSHLESDEESVSLWD